MTTVTVGTFWCGVAAALAFGFLLGAGIYRWHHERMIRLFNGYRGAMLDDWRAASDKVMRMRDVIRRARTLKEVRDALWRDDAEHPPLPVGPPTMRRSESP